MKTRWFTIQIVAALVLVVSTIALFFWAEKAARAVARLQVPPTPQSLTHSLLRSGLGPDHLTAAGVSANDAEDVVTNAAAYLTEHPLSLKNADRAVRTAQQDLDTLRRSIQAGLASDEQLESQATLASTLAAALSAQATALNAFLEAACQELSSEQKSLLATIRSNSNWEMPLQYLAVVRTEPQWVSVREALAAQRIAAAADDELSGEIETFLTQIDSDPTVAAAAASLSTNLAAVTTMWQQGVNESSTIE